MLSIRKKGKAFIIETDEEFILEEVLDRIECRFQEAAHKMEYGESKKWLDYIIQIQEVLDD